MKITVRFFAQLRELTGADELALEVEPGLTAGALKEQLAARRGFGALAGMPVLIAVDEEFARAGDLLSPDCVVAFLPPVSGG